MKRKWIVWALAFVLVFAGAPVGKAAATPVTSERSSSLRLHLT